MRLSQQQRQPLFSSCWWSWTESNQHFMSHYFQRLIMPITGQHFWVIMSRSVYSVPFGQSLYLPKHCPVRLGRIHPTSRTLGLTHKVYKLQRISEFYRYTEWVSKNSRHFWLNITQRTHRIKEAVMGVYGHPVRLRIYVYKRLTVSKISQKSGLYLSDSPCGCIFINPSVAAES